MLEKINSCTFFSVSLVDATGIKSKWQAHFTGVYPIIYDKLPDTLPSDKEFFEKHWKGDNHTTYEQYMERNKC